VQSPPNANAARAGGTGACGTPSAAAPTARGTRRGPTFAFDGLTAALKLIARGASDRATEEYEAQKHPITSHNKQA